MLYLIKSYLKGNKFIYKIGFSEDSNIKTRLSSYFYMNPGSEIISLRQGDEMLEDLIHYYLYYLGYRYQKNSQLNEWFIGDLEVLSIFHISRESLERKLWKHRNEVFNKDKFKSSIAIKTLDFNLFKYLYNKNKDTFVGERCMLTGDKQVIKFRQKQYVLQESHQRLEESQKFLPSLELENIYGKCRVEVERNGVYEKQYQKTTYQSTIKKLVNDLKHWYLYKDGSAGGETHYLSEFSRIGKFLTFSKTINHNDRLNYRIYSPEVKNGVYQMRVVLISCFSNLKRNLLRKLYLERFMSFWVLFLYTYGNN